MQWVAPWPRSPGEAVAQRVSARAAGLQQQSPVILHSMTPGHAIVADRHPDNSRQRPQGPASTRKLAKHIHWGPLWTCGVRAGLTSRGVATQRDAFARGLQVTTRFRNGSRNRQLETGERKNMQKAFYLLKDQNLCQKRNVRRERCVFSPLYFTSFLVKKLRVHDGQHRGTIARPLLTLRARRCIMTPPRRGRSRSGRFGTPILFSFLLLLLVPRGASALVFKPRPEEGTAIPRGVTEAQAILKAAGVTDPKVLKRFADEEMDVAALFACQRADLEELGVTKRGQQIKLNEELAKYLARQINLIDNIFAKWSRLVASKLSQMKEWIVDVWGSWWAYAAACIRWPTDDEQGHSPEWGQSPSKLHRGAQRVSCTPTGHCFEDAGMSHQNNHASRDAYILSYHKSAAKEPGLPQICENLDAQRRWIAKQPGYENWRRITSRLSQHRDRDCAGKYRGMIMMEPATTTTS